MLNVLLGFSLALNLILLMCYSFVKNEMENQVKKLKTEFEIAVTEVKMNKDADINKIVDNIKENMKNR